MKGLEVTFGGKTVRVAKTEHLSLSILINRINDDDLRFHFSGLAADTKLAHVWYVENLKLGDEIIIKHIRNEEIDKSSETICTHPYNTPKLTVEEQLQGELEHFRKLESMLKEKGLIKD
jgi:hypothetical protein